MEPYIGKFCNKCGRTLYEDDEVIICPACLKPHHVSCWIEEEGCATKGCTERDPKKRQKEDAESKKALKPQSSSVKKKKRFLPVILLLLVLAGAGAAAFFVPKWKDALQSLFGAVFSPAEKPVELTLDNVDDYLKVSYEVEDGKSKPSVVSKEVQYFGEGTVTASVKSVQPGGYSNVTVELKISYKDFNASKFQDGYGWHFQYGGEILPYGESSKLIEKTVSVDLDQFGAGSTKEKLLLRGRLTSDEVANCIVFRNGVFPFIDISDSYFTIEITGVQGSVTLDN